LKKTQIFISKVVAENCQGGTLPVFSDTDKLEGVLVRLAPCGGGEIRLISPEADTALEKAEEEDRARKQKADTEGKQARKASGVVELVESVESGPSSSSSSVDLNGGVKERSNGRKAIKYVFHMTESEWNK
jgi:hypothetical protein